MTSPRGDLADPREPLLASRVRAWADQAVEPIDALAIARAASAASRSRGGLIERLRRAATTGPAARPFGQRRRPRPVFAQLAFLVSLVALAFATMALLLTAGRPATLLVGPSPTASDDLLDRLVKEELAPGVYRVVGDGTDHDLAPSDIGRHVKAGPDGSVWLIDLPGGSSARRFFRLGQPGTHDGAPLVGSPDVAIGRDGTVWTIATGANQGGERQSGSQLLAWAGGAWAIHDPPAGHRVNGVEVATDGSVLVTGFPLEASGCPGRPVAWRVGGDGWHELPALPDEVRSAGGGAWLATRPDGSMWLAVDAFAGHACAAHGGLYQYSGTSWAGVPDVPSGAGVETGWPVTGPTGATWLFATPDSSQVGRVLARHDVDAWAVFAAADRVPAIVGTNESRTAMGVGLDGTLYMAFNDSTESAFEYNRALGVFDGPDDMGPCPGVRTFDGRTWQHHLGGRCANDLSVTPDGLVWVVAKPDPFAAIRTGLPPDEPGLYVIDPTRLASPDGAAMRERP